MFWSRFLARGSSLATLGIGALSAVALLWVSTGASAVTPRARGTVVLFGSSSMRGMLGHVIAKDFEQLGFDVMRRGVVSAGLARPDFRDISQILRMLPIVQPSTSVLLYVGVNDAKALWLRPEERAARNDSPWLRWNDARWESIYEARMVDLINAQCERGAKHMFVLPPADVDREPLQFQLERVRMVQQRAAQASKCGRHIPTTGDRGQFEIDGRSLRSRDGVHMSRTGAHRVWDRIRPRVLAVLGYPDLPQVHGVHEAIGQRAPGGSVVPQLTNRH